jgi:hypothetical protein
MVEVDIDPGQDAKYDAYVRQIEAALKSDDPSDKAKILGLLARMALVAIHAELDEGYSWKNADAVNDPSSPKFEALAERVLANRTCGHIVFVDNVAAHRWVKDTLVAAGIAGERIGVLNAEVAPNAADRQRIAREFNGDAEEGLAPKFDVVIANAIAYEGIDLQTRTCAIHHLDLPWEPATLQQRNGRGVRQGNTLSAIAIYYYFSRRSQDGLRFNLIQGKRGWMTQLLRPCPQLPVAVEPPPPTSPPDPATEAALYSMWTSPGLIVTRSSTRDSASRRSSIGRCFHASITASRKRSGSSSSMPGTGRRAGRAASWSRAVSRWASSGADITLASFSSMRPLITWAAVARIRRSRSPIRASRRSRSALA